MKEATSGFRINLIRKLYRNCIIDNNGVSLNDQV